MSTHVASVTSDKKTDKLASQQADLDTTLKKLKRKSQKLFRNLLNDGAHRENLKNEIMRVSSRLGKVIKRIESRKKAKKEYGKTLLEVQACYDKIVENSNAMMQMLAEQAAAEAQDDEEVDPLTGFQASDDEIKECVDDERKTADKN
jgi:DNA repair ATPase RecN